MTFKEKVLDIVAQIPKGEVLTYAQVAKKAGSPKAYRAVANLMKANYNTKVFCHRVIRTDGRIGDYNRGGMEEKIRILTKEGVKIKEGRVI